MARTFVSLHRKARRLRSSLNELSREVRSEARVLLKEIFDLQMRIEEGFDSPREELLSLRRMRELEDLLARLAHEPRFLDRLTPETMLGPRRPLQLVVERPLYCGHSRLPWPLQYDLYRFEVLGKLVFHFLDEETRKEQRTEKCIARMHVEGMMRDHQPRDRPIDKHDGVLAVRPRRRKTPEEGTT